MFKFKISAKLCHCITLLNLVDVETLEHETECLRISSAKWFCNYKTGPHSQLLFWNDWKIKKQSLLDVKCFQKKLEPFLKVVFFLAFCVVE